MTWPPSADPQPGRRSDEPASPTSATDASSTAADLWPASEPVVQRERGPVDVRLVVPALAAWAGAFVVLLVAGALPDAGARRHSALAALVVGGLVVLAAVVLLARGSRRPVASAGVRIGIVVALLGASAGVVAAALHILALSADPLAQWAHDGRQAVVVARVESAPATPSGPSWKSAGQRIVRMRAQSVTVGSATVEVDVPITARIPFVDSTNTTATSSGTSSPAHPTAATDDGSRFTPATASTDDAGQTAPPIGSVVRMTGTVHAGRGIDSALTIAARTLDIIAPPNRVDALANDLRAGLLRALDGVDASAASLVNGLAVGGTSGMPPMLEQDMRTVGLSHLTAVSGGNVAIVLGAVLLVAGMLRLPLPFRIALAVVALAFFVVLVRPQPSVLRAAVMGAVTVLALLSGGRRSGPSVLAAAVFALVVLSPPLAVSWGFALSVMATAGIVLLAPAIETRLHALLGTDAVRLRSSRPRRMRTTRTIPGSPSPRHRSSPRAESSADATRRLQTDLSTDSLDRSSRRTGGFLDGRIRRRLRGVPPVVVQAIALTTAAQVMTAPLIVAMGATIGWTALPANLLAAPAVPAVTILGLLAALVSPVSLPLAAICATAASVPAAWVATVAERTAALPGAIAPIPPGPPGVLVLSAAVVLSVAVVALWRRLRPRRRDSRRGVVGALVLALVVALVVVTVAGRRTWVPTGWLFVACDVGQGDALVLRSAAGTTVLIDTGPEPIAVDRCLADLGLDTLDLVLLTHYDADHIGGLAGALHGRTVGRALLSPVTDGAERADEVTALLATTATTYAQQGQRIGLPGIDLQVLWPRATPLASESVQNDNSIVALAAIDGVSVLLTGDIEQPAQAAVARMMPAGGVDIAKVPHHGSGNMDPALAVAAHARLAVFSVGADNDYGHPHPDTVAAWGASGAMTARTDTQGAIAITHDESGALSVATSN